MSFDFRELDALAVDLGRLGAESHKVVRGVYAEASGDLVRRWAANETEASGDYAKHYVRAISAEEVFSTDVVFEVGPDSSKPQGRMSFEYGSVKQPPHLSGNRAADELVPLIERRISTAVLGLF